MVAGGRGYGVMANGVRFPFGDDGNVLELKRGDGYTVLECAKYH